MMSTTVSMMAQAMGPPPKVVPRSSVRRCAATWPAISSAEHGKPAPSALAVVSMSGAMPCMFAANGKPVRPIPHWTSSQMSSAPAWIVRARSAARYVAPRSTAPATPCTGSTITAAVSAETARSTAARSPRGMNSTSNGACGNPYHFCAAPQVTAPAAAVRPWKLPSIATTLRLPVMRSAVLIAFSLASAPVFTKKTVSRPRPANRARRVAARSRTPSGTALLWNSSVLACDSSAASRRGCEYPSAATA